MNRDETRRNLLLSSIFLIVLGLSCESEAKVLATCDAVKELQRGGISRTMMSNWICLMKSESGMNTRLVTGPKTASSYSFGIFQINSRKWCVRGRPGGVCNKKCEDFADDNIQDDIVCALKIHATGGFKEWDGWVKKCKRQGSALPDIGQCKRK